MVRAADLSVAGLARDAVGGLQGREGCGRAGKACLPVNAERRDTPCPLYTTRVAL